MGASSEQRFDAREHSPGVWFPPPFRVPQNYNNYLLTTSVVVASSQARLHGFTVYSSNTGAQFILVFDATALPADGTVPALVLPVAATSTVSAYFGSIGRWFDRGIVLCNSSTGPTKTIGSPDCLFDVQWE